MCDFGKQMNLNFGRARRFHDGMDNLKHFKPVAEFALHFVIPYVNQLCRFLTIIDQQRLVTAQKLM